MLSINLDAIASLRTDLRAADWTVDHVEALIGPMATSALAREQFVPAHIALQDQESPAALLTRLFLLAEELTDTQLALAFPTCDPEKLGLVRGGRALVDLRPYPWEGNNWWVCSDLGESQTKKPLKPEHVLGIGQATISLLHMTVRSQMASALDLGTGCGILALCLSTHCERVVATDLSERACSFARFNAALNGATNIDVRQGSLFEPVEGERFDLITSNPPFVITPQSVRESRYMDYRDGGMDRDNLIATVVHQGPKYLEPQGILQMLANWEIRGDDDWYIRPQSWLSDSADAWLVQRDLLDPAQYVEMWLRDSGEQDTDGMYRAWLQDFIQAGVTGIGMGFIAMRRLEETHADAQAVFVHDEVEQGHLPDGTAIVAALENLQLPSDWNDRRIKVSPDVREVRYFIPGHSDPSQIRITQGAGMGRDIQVSTHMAALLGVADGELTCGQIIHALAAITGDPVTDVEEQIAATLPELVRFQVASLLDRT